MSLTDYQSYISTLLTDPAEQEALFGEISTPLTKSINIIQSRIPTSDFVSITAPQGRSLTSTPYDQLTHMHYIDRSDRSIPLGSTRWHQAGYYYIQEIAASIPAHVVDIPPRALVLDMCAAPGGKSIQLADRMATEQPDAIGCVRSNDVDPKRITVLQANLNRCGLAHTTVSKINGASFGAVFPEVFDSILLDAPCSGEGTGYKSASAYERRSESGVRKIANLQQSLLISAAKACKVGGSIVYSTCTLNHRENELNLRILMDTYPDTFELEDVHISQLDPGITHYSDQSLLTTDQAQTCIRCRPHRHQTGGFFVSKLRKKSSILKPYSTAKASRKQQSFSTPLTHSKAQDRHIAKQLEEQFGITIDPRQHTFVTSSKKVFLTSPTIIPFLSSARFEKVGIPIAKIIKKSLKLEAGSPKSIGHDFVPLQHLANTLGHLATKHTISITEEQAQRYIQGESLTTDDIGQTLEDRQHYIICVGSHPLSIAKHIDGVLKNKFVGV